MSARLDVYGMHCERCVDSVTRALQAVPGVRRVQVVLPPGEDLAAAERVAQAGLAEVDGEASLAALLALPAVRHADVQFNGEPAARMGRVRVIGDVPRERIAQAIRDAGFEVPAA